nr:MAG TPA: hypothetical protein [Caudoviricetes sp.]
MFLQLIESYQYLMATIDCFWYKQFDPTTARV